MPFLDHLEELRRVLIFVGIVVGVGAAGAWYWSGDVLDWLIQNTSGDAIFMRPQGAFIARIKVAIVLGLMATLPLVFYKIWSFVGPGLLETERKFVLPGVLFSLLLFYLGVAFSYFVLTPLMVDVLLGFGNTHLQAQTEITFLLDLVFTMGMASGLIFQMPLVLAFLTIINIITPTFLKLYWRHAIVLIFISAALLTPADPVSQVLLAVPLILLYGISLVICTIIYKGKRKSKPKGDPNAVSR
ncbi:MAG: twin-arginine translocase subunit TatC [Candidatus Eisenbacteria bacterium]|uniref:Sec-independent protein translocase protein TatC n=1 Tax=Eiseniibacteriota bacterium TaxID=2212470 RepID=A0A7Y2EET6_UNCEI|nr:twin-arginine translocase subunit TatC [Candidatus Eisenbacteria bacterium]